MDTWIGYIRREIETGKALHTAFTVHRMHSELTLYTGGHPSSGNNSETVHPASESSVQETQPERGKRGGRDRARFGTEHRTTETRIKGSSTKVTRVVQLVLRPHSRPSAFSAPDSHA